MNYISRSIERRVQRALERGKSVLLLGPRQTGKTTLVSRIDAALRISLVRPAERLRYEKDPDALAREVEAVAREARGSEAPLVVLDEVQLVPRLLDVVQDLVDRRIARFVLCGSSARKLRRRAQTNLLPGRVVSLRLDPFTVSEYPAASLEQRLLYGELPSIITVPDARDREEDLRSYVEVYLEQEVRAEALVRNLGPFASFLELAAAEAGRIVNLSRLSRQIGVAHTTVAAYYQILEDCLLAERIPPLVSGPRRKLVKSSRMLFFDLGVRRIAAGEGTGLTAERMGELFEQWVGLELLRVLRSEGIPGRLRFWRDADGPEVDWVVERQQRLIPVEVKWTDTPSGRDARHLITFMKEYPQAERGFVVCRTPRPALLAPGVTAIPWTDASKAVGS